ncbi:MAG: bifunctional (p)ppGpp synthetase/guanosine-3',5'-bis(diphosphate) 3'-pyrophosphohydrolase [Betaproteobacteria bacterium]|nr:MAG: bifunctional (p)ppGpp synthetase/guanosine-3',5'-bis(diphosphate) 3'-pyrophosphohydrolase [Betaproteobacteria bacterium]
MVSSTRSEVAEIGESDVLNAGLSGDERRTLARALDFAASVYGEKLLGTGESAYGHAIGLARNVAELRLDADTRVAGLLFSVPQYLSDGEEKLGASFGAAVASLVAGIGRLNALRVITRTAAQGKDSQSQAEVLRKMLLAMVEDIRVVLLRLASRTQTMRWLARAPEGERAQLARETLDIYAPLANRLGVWQLKWELEDLSFRTLEPELYKRIAGMLEDRRSERERAVDKAIAELADELARAGIRSEITGRPKHLYSIYSKMRAKSLDFSEIHDVSGLRVLVGEVKDCYTVLGVVHDLWAPIPREFDDYISRPKANLYRSLHTAVIGPEGKALEVQIRTHEMHRDAELGVAAHWRYKEGAKRPGGKGDPFDERIAWLRQMLAWRDEIVDASDWVERSKHAVLDDTVYVLTPQGRVVDLPRGATPVDFAYALHTDIGHRCRGAKVNGAIVPLDYRLKNAESVEIITAKTGGPSRDWLNPALGYIKSSRARNKVRQWFNSREIAGVLAAGRAAVERELQRSRGRDVSLEELAKRLGFGKPDELFAAVGHEEVGPRQLRTALRGEPERAQPPQARLKSSSAGRPRSGILVVGVERLLTQLARCCKPVPPDRISGFVTKGRGVSVHRRDCPSFARLVERFPERAIGAEWGGRAGQVYPVDIVVRGNDRQGLLRDVTETLSRERTNVIAAKTQNRHNVASMFFTVEVEDIDQLRRALSAIEDVRGVFAAARR